MEKHPWSELAFLYAGAMDKAELPLQLLSYTGALYLMMESSKWYPLAPHFDKCWPGKDFVHVVIGPVDAVDKFWTRASVNVAITGALPKPTEEQKLGISNYDHVVTPTQVQASKLAEYGISDVGVVPPDRIGEFLRRFL